MRSSKHRGAEYSFLNSHSLDQFNRFRQINSIAQIEMTVRLQDEVHGSDPLRAHRQANASFFAEHSRGKTRDQIQCDFYNRSSVLNRDKRLFIAEVAYE
jgi:hypothetical protein